MEEFARALEDALSGRSSANSSERWENFREAVYNATMSTFGKSTDWFEAHSVELIPVTVEKRKALAAYKHGLPQRTEPVGSDDYTFKYYRTSRNVLY